MAVLILASVVAQVVVVWRVLRDDALRRDQDHEFMLGVLERLQAKDLGVIVQAEAAREAIAASRGSLNTERTVESDGQNGRENQGLWNEIDEGRRAMLDAGLDPNNPTDVAGWNQRYGGFQV